jgi:HEAT repeat protein
MSDAKPTAPADEDSRDEPADVEMSPEDLARARARFKKRGAPVWVKLWSLVVVTNLGGFLVAIWVARLVRGVVDSATTETALLFAYYAAMALCAAMDALLLDELLFKGAFRRTHLQGRSAKYSRSSEDVDGLAVTLQRSTMSFPFLLLVAGFATYNLFNLVNGDFDVYHRRVGKHISALHQGDTPTQIEAVRELSIRREPAILPALRWRLEQGGEPAAWSAWALGRFTDLPTRRPLITPLVAASRSDDPAVRREALIALGRIQHRAAADAIQAELVELQSSEQDIDPRLVYALASVQTMSSIEVLADLLHRGDPQLQRLVAWALAQHRDQRGGRAVVEMLEERLPTAPFEVRCAIVHSLGILADERSNLALMRTYDQATPAERSAVCPRWQLSLRPDGELDDRVDLFVPQESLAMKVLMSMAQMRASSPEIRQEVEPWLEGLIGNTDAPVGVHEGADALLTGIREGRDDTQMKSVDEALGLQE